MKVKILLVFLALVVLGILSSCTTNTVVQVDNELIELSSSIYDEYLQKGDTVVIEKYWGLLPNATYSIYSLNGDVPKNTSFESTYLSSDGDNIPYTCIFIYSKGIVYDIK